MRPKVTHGGRQHEPDGKVVRSRLRSVAAQVRLLEGEIYYQNACDVPSMQGEFWSRELASLVSSSFTIEKLEPITDSACTPPSVLKGRGYTQFARSSFWQTSNAGLSQFPGSLKPTHTVAAGVGSIALQLGFAAISGDRLWFLLQPSSVGVCRCFYSCCASVLPPTGNVLIGLDMLLIGVFAVALLC